MPPAATRMPVQPQERLQAHQVAARTADQQHAQQVVLIARERHRVEGLGVRALPQGPDLSSRWSARASISAMQRAGALPPAPLDLDQLARARTAGPGCGRAARASPPEAPAWRGTPCRVAGRRRRRACGPRRSPCPRPQSESVNPSGSSSRFRKAPRRVPAGAAGQPFLLVAEPRRPLGRRDDGAIARHQLQQIEPVRGGQRVAPHGSTCGRGREAAMSEAVSRGGDAR